MSTESRVTVERLGDLFLLPLVSWRAAGGHLAPIIKTLACKRLVLLSLKGSDFTDGSFWGRSRGASVALAGKSDTAKDEEK